MFAFIILILLSDNFYSQSTKYCPSASWVECGVGGGTCYIPPSIKGATVSYGVTDITKNPPVGKWIFAQVSNVQNNNELMFACTSYNFGDSHPNVGKGCCYKENDGPSTNENNWHFLTTQNEQFSVSHPTYIRYGLNNQYSYRWMNGQFTCSDAKGASNPKWFIDITKGTKACWELRNNSLPGSTIQCGDQKGSQSCNLDITGNGGSIQLVQYGDTTNTYKNTVYSYLYSTNQQFSCTNNQFGNPNPSAPDNYCSILNSTVFQGAKGYWSVAASCGGSSCIINEEITEGVTSTTSESCTTSWTKSLSYTISGSLSFFCISKSQSLTESQSETVSKTVSQSYSRHESKSCGATCGNGAVGTWVLFQWVMTVGEYVGPDIVPFQIYTCYYICSTISIQPQCPPTYCADRNCQNCTGYP